MGEGSSGTWCRRRAAVVALLPAAALLGGCATWTYPTTDATAVTPGSTGSSGTQAEPLPPHLQEALRNAAIAGRRAAGVEPAAVVGPRAQEAVRDAVSQALPMAAPATPVQAPDVTAAQPVAASTTQAPANAPTAPLPASAPSPLATQPLPAESPPAAEPPPAATEPAAEPPAEAAGPTAGQRSTAVEDKIVALANSARQAAGVAPLQRSGGIDSVAAGWAVYLASNGLDLQHNGSFSSQIPGGWSGAAENIGRIDDDGRFNADEVASRIHQSWMNSAGHAANLLNPAYTHIGVGVAVHPERGYYLVQDFATY